MMQKCRIGGLVMLNALCLIHSAEAELTRFEIVRQAPFADGRSFGDAGAYERIVARAFFEIDPELPQNQAIIDLQAAPVNKSGHVEFSADVEFLAPQDLARASGALLYDVNNRGNKLAIRFFNDGPGGNTSEDPGHGFLMNQGWIVAWSGWDGELLPGNGRLQLIAPVAGSSEHAITGQVRYEVAVSREGETRVNVNGSGHGAYRPTANGLNNVTLTWRLRPDDTRIPIPRSQFQIYVQESEAASPGQLPQVELGLPAGFQPGYLYELIYEARDPLVHGVTFASVRDLISALRHGTGAGNPLLHAGKSVVQRTHGFGVSQSGRYLREFLYAGFNADEQGRKVFDGLIPHVAGGGLGSFNHRFAQPSTYNSQQEYHEWPSDRFPFTYETHTDHLTGRTDGILNKAIQDDVVPYVVHTQSSAEYWSRSGSLAHTDSAGTADATLPDCVRMFAFGGTQHGPAGWPPDNGIGQTPANPGDYRPFLRALLVALDHWCAGGAPVPPSVYPTLSSGQLVDWRQASTGFPAIPGVRYPALIQQPPAFDLGPRWQTEGIIDVQPPRIIGRYPVLAARTDADGNVLGCLLPPEVAVPVATYTGWNLRQTKFGADSELVKLAGSYIRFPLTEFERQWSGDPRVSVAQRYPSLSDYQNRLRRTCQQLAAVRYLLTEDIDRIVATHTERVRPLFEQISADTAFASEPTTILDNGAGEGPAWHPQQGLLFSGDGGINQYDRDGQLRLFRPNAGTNGLLFDTAGRLVACEPKLRRVTRTELDGTITVLTDHYEGRRYNQPNDLSIDSRGRIYFSDPKYGPRDQMEMRDADGREIEGVYRIDSDGTVTRIITHEVDRPNGLLVTADDRRLFVADNNNNTVGGAHKLWRFDLRPDGTVDPGTRVQIFDWQTGRGPDGMAQDIQGRLYVAAGRDNPQPPYETAVRYPGGVYVFSTNGRLIDLIRTPRDEVTNCTFGGDDLKTLFITAGGSLWSVKTTAPGRVVFPTSN